MQFDAVSTRRAAALSGISAIALLIVAFPASAQTDAAKADGGKRVCRAAVPTGTIMSHKTCRTKAEWAQLDAEAERAFLNRRNSNTVERSQGGAEVGLDSFGNKPG